MYKIARDEQGNRLSYMKITGGTLKVKDLLTTSKGNVAAGEEIWEEKADQIRIYSGAKFELAKEAKAGTVCAVTGLTHTFPARDLESRKIPTCLFWSCTELRILLRKAAMCTRC